MAKRSRKVTNHFVIGNFDNWYAASMKYPSVTIAEYKAARKTVVKAKRKQKAARRASSSPAPARKAAPKRKKSAGIKGKARAVVSASRKATNRPSRGAILTARANDSYKIPHNSTQEYSGPCACKSKKKESVTSHLRCPAGTSKGKYNAYGEPTCRGGAKKIKVPNYKRCEPKPNKGRCK